MADTTQPKRPDISTVASPNENDLPARRYADAISALHAEALRRNEEWQFADVLTWHLAHVAATNGAIFGEVLSRLGRYTREITEQRWAEAEAECVKNENQLQH
jgi:hypothetical protein